MLLLLLHLPRQLRALRCLLRQGDCDVAFRLLLLLLLALLLLLRLLLLLLLLHQGLLFCFYLFVCLFLD